MASNRGSKNMTEFNGQPIQPHQRVRWMKGHTGTGRWLPMTFVGVHVNSVGRRMNVYQPPTWDMGTHLRLEFTPHIVGEGPKFVYDPSGEFVKSLIEQPTSPVADGPVE